MCEFWWDIAIVNQTTEKAIILKEKHLAEDKHSLDDEVIYKIEVPANRFPLLILIKFDVTSIFSFDRI